jgi:UDP-N-acetylmuramate: L-alanyl-gamma-D-glutamyl-meso-diaminopimelate ligase
MPFIRRSMEKNNIYIIGIGGTLMSNAAVLLKEEGYNVWGSDNKLYPPTSDILKDAKIKVFEGFKKENITDDIDLVLVGNIISKGHVEMEEVLNKNIKYTSFPAFLEEKYLNKYNNVVVVGTHGKTTTTTMAIHIFEKLGLNPGYFVGAKLENKSSIKLSKKNAPFIIEGDEYDTAYFDKVPKFYHYKPKVGILTSVEFDHADIYDDIYQLRNVFHNFIEMVPKDGLLVFWDGIVKLESLGKNFDGEKVSYGFNPMSDIYCYSYLVRKDKMEVSLKLFKKDMKFSLPMFGKHNVLNFMAVLGALSHFTDDFSKVQKALDSFLPPKRRQEVILDKNGILVIDDFAHHPTAIRETISAIKMKYPKNRLITIFEPRSNTSRQNIFKDSYIESFLDSSWVILRDVEKHRLIPDEKLLNVKELISELKSKNIKADFGKNGDDILSILNGRIRKGDIILIMSNGGFDNIYENIEKIL